MPADMVHSRKEGLGHSGLTASIPGGDEAGGAGHTASAAEIAAYDICVSYGHWELEERAAGRSGIPTPDDAADWTANFLVVCSAISRGVVFSLPSQSEVG